VYRLLGSTTSRWLIRSLASSDTASQYGDGYSNLPGAPGTIHQPHCLPGRDARSGQGTDLPDLMALKSATLLSS
jgi:hypothetical protein